MRGPETTAIAAAFCSPVRSVFLYFILFGGAAPLSVAGVGLLGHVPSISVTNFG